MARIKGDAPFSSSFEPQKASPIADIFYCETFADLINSAEQQAHDGLTYLYYHKMAIVYNDSANNGTYWLIDTDNPTDANSWEKVGSGTGLDNFSYKKIDTGKTVTIPAGQQMIVADETLDVQGSLDVQGEVKLINTTSVSSVSDLSDTLIDNIQNGDLLYFDGTNWINKQYKLNDITDVDIQTPANNDILKFNGTKWVNLPSSAIRYFNKNGSILYNGGALSSYSNDSFVVGSQTMDYSGQGSRMFFNKSKSAFRAGYENGTLWNDAKIGQYSSAFCRFTEASGFGSFVGGQVSTASAFGATAIGNSSGALASNATAVGPGAIAYAFSSTALGVSSRANGNESTSFGPTIAGSYQEIAIGRYNNIHTIYSSADWDTRDVLFSIGVGRDNNNRDNLITAFKDGKVYYEQTMRMLKGLVKPVKRRTADYTIIDTDQIILADATAGNITITLPASGGTTEGQVFTIKRIENAPFNNVYVDGNGNNIDGSASVTLSGKEKIEVVFSNNEWYII